ncbi:MAG: hypothetical protein SFV81_03810 [Pirellulaceae bacterium]|nr:hypothetical protein [Pirellulaceae bacterium]
MIRKTYFMPHFKYHLPCVALSIALTGSFGSMAHRVAAQVPEVTVPNPVRQVDSQVSPSDTNAQPKSETEPAAESESADASAPAKPDSPSAAPSPKPAAKSEDEAKKVVEASAADPISRDLQNIALQARKQLDKDRLPEIESARRELITALENLERFLATNPKQVEAWNAFLRLDSVREQAHAEKPDTALLIDLETSMRQNYLGLEYPQYTKLRESLLHFHRALRFSTSPEQTIKAIDVRLERLVETLNEPFESETERSEVVGVIANYLDLTNQAPDSLAAFRTKYSHPNVQAYVRESFVSRMLVRPVAQPSDVNECLLGTRVVGTAFLNGNVSADLMPSNNGVSLCLNLNANMSTNSTGYNRGVVIRSTGGSPIQASKQIFVSPIGISSTAASVATDLQTQINSIEHRSRIVRRIATRKAAETQPQANVIAEGRLQNRVRSQFDQQVEEQLGQARVQFSNFQQQSQSRPELTRIGWPMPTYTYNSTTNAIHGLLTQRTKSQLSALKPCDLPKSSDAQVILEAHQSAMMNAIDVFLGGRTLRNNDLDDLVKQFGGKVTPELEKEANSDPWSITFAAFHPIQIDLNDGLVNLTLRIGQMTRGDQVLKQDASVTAVYRPTVNNGYFRMDREGDVKIEFFGKISNIAAVSMRAFLKGKFEDTFKPLLVNAPINLPAPKQANVPPVQISDLQLDNGWLQVNLR